MAFLTIAGMTVEASIEGAGIDFVFIGDSARALDGSYLSTRRATKKSWKGRTAPLSMTTAQALAGILTRKQNLLLSPDMDTDTDANGAVNDWQAGSATNVTATYSLNVGRQRIVISGNTAGAVTRAASVFQVVGGFEEGEVVSLSIYTDFDSLVGCTGYVQGAWRNSSSSEISTFESLGLTNTTDTRVSLASQTAPSGAYELLVTVGLSTAANGDTGTGWFWDAQLERGTSVLDYTSSNIEPVAAYGDFMRSVGYTTSDPTYRRVFPELVGWTPVSVGSSQRIILDFVLHEA